MKRAGSALKIVHDKYSKNEALRVRARKYALSGQATAEAPPARRRTFF